MLTSYFLSLERRSRQISHLTVIANKNVKINLDNYVGHERKSLKRLHKRNVLNMTKLSSALTLGTPVGAVTHIMLVQCT